MHSRVRLADRNTQERSRITKHSERGHKSQSSKNGWVDGARTRWITHCTLSIHTAPHFSRSSDYIQTSVTLFAARKMKPSCREALEIMKKMCCLCVSQFNLIASTVLISWWKPLRYELLGRPNRVIASFFRRSVVLFASWFGLNATGCESYRFASECLCQSPTPNKNPRYTNAFTNLKTFQFVYMRYQNSRVRCKSAHKNQLFYRSSAPFTSSLLSKTGSSNPSSCSCLINGWCTFFTSQ